MQFLWLMRLSIMIIDSSPGSYDGNVWELLLRWFKIWILLLNTRHHIQKIWTPHCTENLYYRDRRSTSSATLSKNSWKVKISTLEFFFLVNILSILKAILIVFELLSNCTFWANFHQNREIMTKYYLFICSSAIGVFGRNFLR